MATASAPQPPHLCHPLPYLPSWKTVSHLTLMNLMRHWLVLHQQLLKRGLLLPIDSAQLLHPQSAFNHLHLLSRFRCLIPRLLRLRQLSQSLRSPPELPHRHRRQLCRVAPSGPPIHLIGSPLPSYALLAKAKAKLRFLAVQSPQPTPLSHSPRSQLSLHSHQCFLTLVLTRSPTRRPCLFLTVTSGRPPFSKNMMP